MKETHWALLVSIVGGLAFSQANPAHAGADDARAWWCQTQGIDACWPSWLTGDVTGQVISSVDWSENNYSGRSSAEVLAMGDWACTSGNFGAPATCERNAPQEATIRCPSTQQNAYETWDDQTLCFSDYGASVVDWFINYYPSWTSRQAIIGDFYASAWLGFSLVSGHVSVAQPVAFPLASEIPLLDALNYWSASEIASNLGVSSSVASAVVAKRISNGGVFFELNEISVSGFNPANHLTNAGVINNAALHSLLAPQVSYNNDIQLYIDGSDTLSELITLIDGAEKFIHLNTMLFFNDKYADLISYALRDAALRGVEVRVMYDYVTTNLSSYNRSSGDLVAGTPITRGLGAKDIILSGCISGVVCDVRSTSQETEYWDHNWYGSYWWSDDVRDDLSADGVPEYMLQMQDYIQDSTETALNVVNHQKYMIVDGTKMMLGSSNFGANYQYEEDVHENKWNWHDGLTIVEGPSVKHAQRIFAQQWFVNARGDIFDFEGSFYSPNAADLVSSSGTAPMALMLSFPGDPKHINMRYMEDLLLNSTGEVYISNPYPTDGDFWSALNSMSSTRASQTHLVTSIGLGDGPTVGATTRCRGRTAAVNGLEVYDYYKGEQFSHLKLTVDVANDMVHYGSYNFNMRSKRHDLELNFLTRDPALAKRAKEIIEFDISKSGSALSVDTYHTDNTWVPECIAERATNWGT